MSFPWGRNQRGGGGDPFRDSSGRPVTNVRASIPASDALKEGMRESPGKLNVMGQYEYKKLLEDQMIQSKKNKQAEEAMLNETLWWEKKERRERSYTQQQHDLPPPSSYPSQIPGDQYQSYHQDAYYADSRTTPIHRNEADYHQSQYGKERVQTAGISSNRYAINSSQTQLPPFGEEQGRRGGKSTIIPHVSSHHQVVAGMPSQRNSQSQDKYGRQSEASQRHASPTRTSQQSIEGLNRNSGQTNGSHYITGYSQSSNMKNMPGDTEARSHNDASSGGSTWMPPIHQTANSSPRQGFPPPRGGSSYQDEINHKMSHQQKSSQEPSQMMVPLQSTQTRSMEAMEVLVLENAGLRRENRELKDILNEYSKRFGPI